MSFNCSCHIYVANFRKWFHYCVHVCIFFNVWHIGYPVLVCYRSRSTAVVQNKECCDIGSMCHINSLVCWSHCWQHPGAAAVVWRVGGQWLCLVKVNHCQINPVTLLMSSLLQTVFPVATFILDLMKYCREILIVPLTCGRNVPPFTAKKLNVVNTILNFKSKNVALAL